MLEKIMDLQILFCIMLHPVHPVQSVCWQYTLLTEEFCEERMRSQVLRKNG